MNIAFFCGGGGSGRIRGKQIGKYLGAKVNPEEGYEHDICIYVKTQPPENHPRNTYLDIVDEPKRVSWLKEHTDVKVIASSLTAYEFLTSSLSNEVVLIPQHHCNYERITKTEEGNSYGVVGKGGAIQNENIPKLFKNFNWVKDYRNRADVIKGYEKIDIQIIWRRMDRPLKTH